MRRSTITQSPAAESRALSGGDKSQQGIVVKFDAERGFGFIRPEGSGDRTDQDVFVHVSEVEGRKNLHPGQHVSYYLNETDKGPAATSVHPGSVLGTPYLLFALVGLGLVMALLIGLMLVLGQPQRLGMWLVLWVFALSVGAFLIYGFDKSQAQRGGLRVPEIILHLWSLLGGSPGAFVAMRVFHHKTSKRSFQAVFWLIVAVQVAVAAYFALR